MDGSAAGSTAGRTLESSKRANFGVGSRVRGGDASSVLSALKVTKGAFVHGTKLANFSSILEHGLKAAISKIFMVEELRGDGCVPGLPTPPELLIFIDEDKARAAGIYFDYDELTDTWQTEGIQGVLRPWFFQKVVDNRPDTRGAVLFQSKDDPVMQSVVEHPPRHVVHGTYYSNLEGIMREGILPGHNPLSKRRGPFSQLLRDAEGVVHCVEPMLAQRETSLMRDGAQIVQDSSETQIDIVGMDEMNAEALVVIDMKRALQHGLQIVQSDEREEHYFIKGRVPKEAIIGVQPNKRVELPPHLEAKIVDPKSFADVPIIDLSQDDAIIVEQLRYACTVVGFMQIVGHGVSEELEERHMRMVRAFFSLPPQKKDNLRVDGRSPVRGFYYKGGENLDKVVADNSAAQETRRVTDNKEGLDLNGVPWVDQPHESYLGRVFGAVHGIPGDDLISGFANTVQEYQQALFKLAMKILRLFALVLEKDPDFFVQYMSTPVCTHRMLHYWPLRDFNKEIGTGEHTDYGLITILKQDNTGGLQVLNAADRQWVHATPVPGAYVVNIGDMMARWTGHYFKSTVHRVVNCSPEDRYSSPYFVEPNMDTRVTPGGLWPGPLQDEPDMTCEEFLDFYYTQSGMLKAEERQAFERGELELRR